MCRFILVMCLFVLMTVGSSQAFELGLQVVFDQLGYTTDVYTDEIEGDVFFQRTDSYAQIIEQISAWERGTALGWYNSSSVDNWLIGGSLTGLPLESPLPDIEGVFGLTIWTQYWSGEGGNYQWYSEREKNWDLADHVHVYATRLYGEVVPHSYLLAWEDLPNLGDADFQDMVVRIDGVQAVQGSASPVIPPDDDPDIADVPEPATFLLFGLGLVALSGRCRRFGL